jgi:hypothetical protein
VDAAVDGFSNAASAEEVLGRLIRSSNAASAWEVLGLLIRSSKLQGPLGKPNNPELSVVSVTGT